MYTPKHFEITDTAVLHDLMRSHGFATIVNVIDGVPFATHMPVTLDAEQNLLTSHIARANPQWKHFSSDTEILIIFQGDHSYVSPNFYVTHPNVPTWNYMTVHAYAKPRILEDKTDVRRVLKDLVMQYEGEQGWDMDSLEDEFVENLMRGIVAFELRITRLEGKFKLSQNRLPADQQGAMHGLSQSARVEERSVAEHMKRFLEKH
jgi:transcriptional regulator